MPSFITDGPEISIEVLQALEDGELVFFCGAGVSKPAGLPLFGELVCAIYESVHEEMTELEKKAFGNGEYDRVLTLLERRVDATQVRSAIATVFERTFNGNLEVHRDLLRLSKTQAGPHWLVTTNFDDLFQRAGAVENHIDTAPRLVERNLLAARTVGTTAARLSDKTFHLARWLARHVHDPGLARWVISNGCVLHPEFRRCIGSQLQENHELRSDLREFWGLIASEAFASLLLRYHNGWYFSEFFDADTSTADARRIADSLRLVPVLSYDDSRWNRVFAATSAESSEEEAEEDGDVSPLWRAVNLQLKLVSRNESIDFIKKARSDQHLLVELVPRLTHNLIEAWDWRLAFHKIERHEDYSRINLTSISPHPQNHGFQDWSKIVELLWDGFVLLAARDLSRARVVAEFWREADYPIFHRLYLFGMAEVDGMARSPDVVTYFKRYPDLIFAPACEREVLRYFRKRGGMLSKKAREWICVRISKGLDRTLYRSMSDDEWERIHGAEVWKRLAALELGGGHLPPRARAELERFQARYGWTLGPSMRTSSPYGMKQLGLTKRRLFRSRSCCARRHAN